MTTARSGLRGACIALTAALTTLVAVAVAPPAAAEPIGGSQLTGSGVIVDPGPDATPLPDIAASTWVLADMDTGAILAAKGPHIPRPPASTLKTLTALTLVPRLDPDEVVTVEYEDIAIEGSRVGIVEGGEYTIAELFYGLIMQSGNDNAAALARANGGLDLTVAQMNEEAQRLQAYDTVAKNPSGLPAEGQLSSAYDLALIAREGLARPDYFEYANTKVINEYPGFMPENPGDPRPTFAIATQNPLFINGYDGAIGLKTGWTTEAGRTFVGAARRDGVSLVVTLMNIQTPIYDAAAPLLDWGFENIDNVTPVGYLVDPVRPAVDQPQPTPTQEPAASPDAAPTGDDINAAPAAANEASGGGWVWGLVAAMLAGLAMVVIGLRNLMRPPPPRPRRSARSGSGRDPEPAAAVSRAGTPGVPSNDPPPTRTAEPS